MNPVYQGHQKFQIIHPGLYFQLLQCFQLIRQDPVVPMYLKVLWVPVLQQNLVNLRYQLVLLVLLNQLVPDCLKVQLVLMILAGLEDLLHLVYQKGLDHLDLL